MLDYDADDPPIVEEINWRPYWEVFRLTLPTQIFWLCVYLIAFLFIAPKAFGEEAGVSEGLVCDTKQQVESYFEIIESGKSPYDSLHLINATEMVCATMLVAYIKGDDVGTIRVEHGSMHIHELTVLGYWHGKWIKLEPMTQYAPFFTLEMEA